ncbi:MAG: GMC family oxidoreductase [Lentimicrobiaceae bacterium]|jgi:cholesterol oxidase|nr:GMC family oxidoreductase [Lentimicrobiaceae bacterium]MBT3454283.1 GMC family oxidoreductase [Lentimicrobiaceae bacterium]MBT3818080.1 GMC family oxidoreductase [Lentimicrobiaceae bacterium]MBT4061501.1 GMC family oxidoreductase [Lentimicrobiaceae bacterium]MBT4189792.1 GMC family oxidoreductase [Lentimicrobiaceae bacterium]
MDFDYIIVGSGFGGSVSALRLSEKGYKVLVVEKGRWFGAQDFPKTNWNLRKWLWIPFLRWFGIMKITIFRHVAIVSGTGVGGGSLVYANTLPIPLSYFFNTGSWSSLGNWEQELAPYYKIALKMLGATRNEKLFDGDLELRTLSDELGIKHKFEHTNVAVYFGDQKIPTKDPYFNGLGPDRTGCNYCGGCMTGCRNNSKNSLDKNYLYLAQKNGAKIMAENEVFNVVPIKSGDGAEGYVVSIKSSTKLFKKKTVFRTKGVVFSGGVLGTIKLLLKLKLHSLPNLSNRLGMDIRTNNETLISISSLDKNKNVAKGVAIGSILHTDDNSHLEVVRYSEGSGFWKLLHLPYASGNNPMVRIFKMFVALIKSPLSYFKVYCVNNWAKSTVVLLFMQTLDSTLKFRRNFFGAMVSSVNNGGKPSPFIPESIALAKKYGQIINGKKTSFALETLAGIPSTAHILGGAVMGKDISTGVIDKNNAVFGYQNMYIADGSVISSNPGVNPSLTITAIAERAMAKIGNKTSTSRQ